MLEIRLSHRFKKDFKNAMQQPYFDRQLFEYVVGELAEQRPLDVKFCDHELSGRHDGLVGCRECHIKPNWLLVYKVIKDELVLYLFETGTHSDIF